MLVAAAAGLLLRLAFGLGYWVGEPLTRDEQEYLSLARSLAAGRGFVYDDALGAGGPADPFDRAPGYPAFLALVGGGHAIATEVPAVVKIAQAFAAVFGILIAGAIAERLAGSRSAAVAAWIAAVYPPLVAVSARAFSEALFWPLGLAAAALLSHAARATGSSSTKTAAVAGLVAGVAALVRPAMIVFVAVAACWLLWRRWPARVVAFTLGAALVVAPWTARNYRVDGRLVLIAADGGVNFWIGNHPKAVGDGDLAANDALKIAHASFRSAHPNLTERELEPAYYREAFGWIAADPTGWLALEARKLFYLVVPVGPSYRLHSLRYEAASAGSYLLILPMAIVGVRRLGEARKITPGLWLLAGSAVLTALVFFPQERYRLSVIDPVLIVCAGTAWARGRDAMGLA
ncbi:MAG TPA: glycosyltransferase family 39 protein [Vicinamibacterales bacterium]|nr:glycosyltransferase family 39 protein [Vicinamibacterales bacterium]